jgi:CubicO group peptidase (beta-lactamase class C family)
MKPRHFFRVICVLLSVPVFPAAQAPAKQSPAERQLARWLAAYDGKDWQVYLAFLKSDFAVQPGGGFRDPALRDLTGGYSLKKIESETPAEVTAVLQERAGDGFVRLVLEVEPVEPHRILNLDVNLIQRPAEFALAPMSDRQLVGALRNRLNEEAASERFSGAVLLAKRGKPIFAQAYGLADRGQNIPNTLESRFSIASINKLFTAVAIMQLVQAGKLSLDDALGKYLTAYPNKDLAAKVTIGALLTNTGGTGDIFGPEWEKHRLELRTPADFIDLYGGRPLRFEPGSRWEYSNYGFILLGAVIEKVSGGSYYDYVREHIYAPAGMNSTDSDPEEPRHAVRSIGYSKENAGVWNANTGYLEYRGTPAGGGYSTVGDLSRFADALRENRLLDAQHTKLLTTARVANPFGFDSYGFGVQSINGNRCFGHNGRGPGVNGDFEMCLDSRYAVVVLANMGPPAAEQVSEFIISRLPASKP